MKKEAPSPIQVWMSQMLQFQFETSGFTVNLSGLSDDGLFPGIMAVSYWFLDFAPNVFSAIKPQHHAELRRAIAYLADLQERQVAAIYRENERFARQSKEQGQVLQILQRLDVTNQEKISLVKNHYGWV